MSSSLERFHRWISCVAIVFAVAGVVVAPKFWSGPRPEGVPYGFKAIPDSDALGMQDFACHIDYLSHIWDRSVGHPYRLEDQERLIRQWCPRNSRGFPHAYSPVALILAAPFLAMNVEWAFFFWTLINAGLLLTLTWGHLFRQMKNPTQGLAIMALYCSYLLLDIFNMGQTALATTCLCAGGYLLLRDRAAGGPAPLEKDLLLVAVLYVLSMKPSIAVIIYALAISQRAWRPVLLSGLGLLFTWVLLAPHYGGYLAGLKDYSWLLNHYYDADMPSFFQGCLAPEISTSFVSFVTTLHPAWNQGVFLLSRFIFEGLIILLMFLGWNKRVSFSTQFLGLLWTFLLFCPYVLVTEDFALCLIVVEGNFFRNGLGGAVKVLLVFLAANIWIGALVHWPLSFILKSVLALWWLLELVAPPRQKGSEPVPAPLAST